MEDPSSSVAAAIIRAYRNGGYHPGAPDKNLPDLGASMRQGMDVRISVSQRSPVLPVLHSMGSDGRVMVARTSLSPRIPKPALPIYP